jgi:HSP20 family protein
MTLIRFKPNTAKFSPATAPSELLRDFMNLQFPFFPAEKAGTTTWAPALDVLEDQDAYTVILEAPGLKKEDFTISYHDGSLSIGGERKDEKPANVDRASLLRERTFGRFTRTVALPAEVKADAIGATYKDGVLTVTLPKAEEAKPKQIEVRISD